jgi:glucose-6-phosphate isomerase
MIKFDFKTYVNNYFSSEELTDILNKKKDVISKFSSSNMIGWTRELDQETIAEIKKTGSYIKNNFDLLVVIGIGGSFLGSYAFDKMFRKYFNDDKFEIIYAGTTLSSKYLDELVNYLKDKNFCINVISKSGTTMETTITYKILKDVLKRKYDSEELKKHIIITTDKESGKLRQEVNKKGYKSFIIPNDIGGRYSFITPAHLLPLSINYDIDKIVKGYFHGKRLIDSAYLYAATRYLLFKHGKFIENFSVEEENISYFCEWLKQLFGETEGKNGKGIYPTSTIYTRDLHSLGQFIQDGNKILFETFLRVKDNNNYIEYDNRNLNEINNVVIDSVIRAHSTGNVPCLEIEMDELNTENIASLIYFFQLAAAFSGYLFEINPFNQPGVEIYKEEVRKSLAN